MNEVKLFSSNDNILISQIEQILKQENIPYVKTTKGAGSYMNIAIGGTIEETEIIVNEDDLSKAEIDENKTEEDIKAEEEIKKDLEKYKSFRKWGVLIVFLICPIVIPIIILIVASILNNL